jgi:hypothetical protein
LPIVKPIVRVHRTMDLWHGRVHGGPSGGALPVSGTPGAVGLVNSLPKAGEEEGDEA